ncbi:hypothetical protein GCM10007862_35370 [Dyella lipolytica]|uniref:Nuclear transport factor 2 family protein n=1 Tax=Dyella lipolytica TaxID=1867835 RepID=A0ABW8IX43_9GAMM|nr:nuclear transport factor 2 family protein [Dyella lipolytica]GLQ48486.1 hypothetical protein GCM10007862_35370 [Dyella lipolytica]
MVVDLLVCAFYGLAVMRHVSHGRIITACGTIPFTELEKSMSRLMQVVSTCVLLMLVPLSAAACGNKSADPIQIVQAQVDAYNAHDIDAFAACYADNVTISDLSGKRPTITGMSALKKAYAFLAREPKDFRVAIIQRAASGPTVVDHERVIGLPADKGQPEAIAVYEVRDGKIQNVWFPPNK